MLRFPSPAGRKHAVTKVRPFRSGGCEHSLAARDHVMNHSYSFVVIGGVSYLLVWIVYRLFRHGEHSTYLRLHREERLARARYDADNGHRDPEPFETVRRAEWDMHHGPLMHPLEIKNREENRWPVGNALQGLATLVTGMFVGTLVWDLRSRDEGPLHQRGGPDLTAVPVTASGTSALDSVFLLCLVLLAAGAIFWSLSKSRYGRYVGGSLVLTASVLSGLKILSIEKFISIGEVTGVKWTPASPGATPPSRPAYTLTFRLPPYAAASAAPSSTMLCAARKIGAALRDSDGLHTIVVVASADRRDLLPQAKRAFGTNWALAQQRGAAIAGALARYAPAGVAMLVTNSGPSNTSGQLDEDRLSQDRVPIVQASGFGVPTSAAGDLAQASWRTVCAE
jgi:hypothetical protein